MRKLRHEEIPRPDLDAIGDVPRHPISVVIDNVRSVYNVGSMFRTSDAAHIEHLYLAGITGTPEHRGLHKTALGAQDTVPWSHHADLGALLQELKDAGQTLAVLEITDTPTPTDALDEQHFPLTLIVGNEVHGVSEAAMAAADIALEIPQYGTKQSLNVAVAYGIAVYDLVGRYRSLPQPQ